MNVAIFKILDLMQRVASITEGATKSYNGAQIIPILKRRFNLGYENNLNSSSIGFIDSYTGMNFKIKPDNDEIINIDIYIFEKYYNKEIKDKISKFLEFCGWRISRIDKDDSQFILRTVKDRQVNDINVPNFLYHVTNKHNVDSILTNGLVPKFKDKDDNHIERIYLTPFYYADQFEDLANQLRAAEIQDFVQRYRSKVKEKLKFKDFEYTVLRIDTNKITYPIKFYRDPQLPGAVWTFDNIPPQAISVFIEQI